MGYLWGILLTAGLVIFFWRGQIYSLLVAIPLAALFYLLREGSFGVFLLKCLLPAVALSLGIRHRRSPILAIFLGVIPHLLILGFMVACWSDMVWLFKFELGEMVGGISSQAQLFGINANSLQGKIFRIGDFLAQLIFGFQLLSSLFEVFLAYFLVEVVGGKLGWDVRKLPAFHLWHSKEGLGWVAVLSLVLLLVGGKLFGVISKNVLLVFGFGYALLGAAVVEWLFKKFKINFWIRTSFYLFVLITQIFSFALLSFLGFFDSWLDFRKLDKKSKTK